MRNAVLMACIIVLFACAVGLLTILVLTLRMYRELQCSKPSPAELAGARFEFSIDDDGKTIRIPVNYAGLRSLSDDELLRVARYKHQVELRHTVKI